MYCREHTQDNMVDIYKNRYTQEGCSKRPSFGVEGSKAPMYCKDHTQDGMVNVVRTDVPKRAAVNGLSSACTAKIAHTTAYWRSTASDVGHDSMVDVYRQRSAQKGCRKWPVFSVKEFKVPVYCKDYAQESMVNLGNSRCAQEGCSENSRS